MNKKTSPLQTMHNRNNSKSKHATLTTYNIPAAKPPATNPQLKPTLIIPASASPHITPKPASTSTNQPKPPMPPKSPKPPMSPKPPRPPKPPKPKHNKYRTHTCNAINTTHIGKNIRIAGWVYRKRNHGGVLFIDLIDHYGITQIVFNENSKYLAEASKIKTESVILVQGIVVARSNDQINNKLATGKVEVIIEQLIIESKAEVLPIETDKDKHYSDDIRLKYRFLDLRRPAMQQNIILRSAVIQYIRELMIEQGFLEIHTPILTSSSPEGARDYLVPSRIHKGKFYALPQAPQQFKQILMASRFDKYFQIAPCFRDEDARADRSPGEFYQLDLEMAFVERQDIFNIAENTLYKIFKQFSNFATTVPPFPIITYKNAMLKYGTDKPDLRNPINIADVTEIFAKSNFAIFVKNIKKNMIVRAIPAPNTTSKPRSFFDKKIEFAQSIGANGLAYINFDNDGNAKGPIAKLINQELLEELKQITNTKNGDSLFFACDLEHKAAYFAGEIRKLLGEELNIIEQNCYKFCWIVDFPYFEYNEETKKIEFSHNPFSMPYGGLDALNSEDPLKILANQYDIVCNGIELSSGAIRNHKLEIIYKSFSIAGYTKEDVDTNFAAIIQAFKFGIPPHGGIAPGIERILMLLSNSPNIRDVVCFPMNQKAEDTMMQAPAKINETQLRELGIKLDIKKRPTIMPGN